MSKIKVRWVLAHEPIELFIRAAEKFAEIVEKQMPNTLDIEILTLSEYSEKYQAGRPVRKQELLDLMSKDEIEMGQMYTYVLRKYNSDLDVLDMPFLFRDHDHAARVFEGPIGEELLASYSKNNDKIQGLAFTYSGGFKNIPSSKSITSLADFAGAKLRTSNSPVSLDTFAAIGAHPVTFDIEDLGKKIGDGTVDGGECTWPRFYHNGTNEVVDTVVETNHTLLLTNIIINTDFLQSLDPNVQAVIRDAATKAARFEREISVDDVGPTSDRARRDGIKVINLTEQEEKTFREATKVVYDKYREQFSNDLVSKIMNA